MRAATTGGKSGLKSLMRALRIGGRLSETVGPASPGYSGAAVLEARESASRNALLPKRLAPERSLTVTTPTSFPEASVRIAATREWTSLTNAK